MSAAVLAERLKSLGLDPPSVRELEPLFARENEALLPFVDWLCTAPLTAANCISETEARSFRIIQAEGAVLRGPRLAAELARAPASRTSAATETLRTEVAMLNDQASTLTQQLHRLRAQRDTLAASVQQQTLQARALRSEHTRVSGSFDPPSAPALLRADRTLAAATDGLARRAKDAALALATNSTHTGPAQKTPPWLLFQHTQHLDETLASEEHFSRALSGYARRKFQEGLAAEAANDSPEQCTLVDLTALSTPDGSDSGGAGGGERSKRQRDAAEIRRLRSIDALTNENLARARVTRAARQAQLQQTRSLMQRCQQGGLDNLGTLTQRTTDDRAASRAAEARCESLWATHAVARDRCATLQGTAVLAGNGDLRLARQRYVHAQQDAFIGHLRRQQQRFRFLETCLEAEEQRVSDVRMLIETASKFAREAHAALTARTQSLQSHAQAAAAERSVVPQADVATGALRSLLANHDPDPHASMLTYERAAATVSAQAKHAQASAAALEEHVSAQRQQHEALRSTLDKCRALLFEGTAEPVITDAAIVERTTALEALLGRHATAIAELKDSATSFSEALQDNPAARLPAVLFQTFHTRPDALPGLVAAVGRGNES